MVSSSNGWVLKFSSENNFEPEKFHVSEDEITGLDFGKNDEILIGLTKGGKIYLDEYFSSFLEFGGNLTGKTNMLKCNHNGEGFSFF